jgi:UDP-glucose 4-epimerase
VVIVIKLIEDGFNPIIVDNLSNSSKWVLENIEKITNTKVPFYEVDCRSKELQKVFEENNIYGTIHFAALKLISESIDQSLKYYDNNINSLINVLNLMDEFQSDNFIFSSSCTIYGETEIQPVTEEAKLQEASTPYGYTKQVGERILKDYGAKSIISLRYFNPIGAHPTGALGELPNGKPNNLVPYIMQTAIGKREKLTIFGDNYNTPDGTCIRDFIDVNDLAFAHIKALKYLEEKTQFYDVYNVGTGKPYSVLELVNTFENIHPIKWEFGMKRNGDIEKIWASNAKVMNELGWSSKVSLSDSLLAAWKWENYLEKNIHE